MTWLDHIICQNTTGNFCLQIYLCLLTIPALLWNRVKYQGRWIKVSLFFAPHIFGESRKIKQITPGIYTFTHVKCCNSFSFVDLSIENRCTIGFKNTCPILQFTKSVTDMSSVCVNACVAAISHGWYQLGFGNVILNVHL